MWVWATPKRLVANWLPLFSQGQKTESRTYSACGALTLKRKGRPTARVETPSGPCWTISTSIRSVDPEPSGSGLAKASVSLETLYYLRQLDVCFPLRDLASRAQLLPFY